MGGKGEREKSRGRRGSKSCNVVDPGGRDANGGSFSSGQPLSPPAEHITIII